VSSSPSASAYDLWLTSDESGTTSFRLGGEIDVTNITAIKRALHLAMSQRPDHLVIDLQAVTFLDSAGLGLVLQAARGQQQAGSKISVVVREGGVRKLLDLIGLTALVHVITAAEPTGGSGGAAQ
jgi:anti-anti-sigma factor